MSDNKKHSYSLQSAPHSASICTTLCFNLPHTLLQSAPHSASITTLIRFNLCHTLIPSNPCHTLLQYTLLSPTIISTTLYFYLLPLPPFFTLSVLENIMLFLIDTNLFYFISFYFADSSFFLLSS